MPQLTLDHPAAVAAPTALPRADLVATLERETRRKVTVISAPPGSGKSFLLRRWAETIAPPRRAVVVQVRRCERDARRFLLSLLDAVLEATGEIDLAGAAAERETDLAAVVERVTDALTGAAGPVVLVIDDLHELGTQEAHAALASLLDRLPPSVRVILSSRHDPPLRLHHLRLQGELAEIRAADLCFAPHETRELLATSGIELSDRDVAVLHDRTEGWAAGVRLAALALAEHPSPQDFIRAFSGSDRTVAEYLLAELLERQPDHVRRLLLRTSIVDRVTGPLADVLCDGAGAQETFQALEDANAFVMSLDPGRSWFRYHKLFGDLLRLELRRSAPDEIPDLHRRASCWFAAHGLPVEAVRHAQAAGEWSQASRLLADHALALSLDGQELTVDALLKTFPDAALEADPELAIVSGSNELAHGSLQQAAEYLALAATRAPSVPDERRLRFDVKLAAAKLSLARRQGDVTDVRRQVELLAHPAGVRSHADIALGGELRAVALMNLGIAELWSWRLDEAQAHLSEAAAIARRLQRRHLEVASAAHLACAAAGESLAVGRKRCAEALALADQLGWSGDHAVSVALAAYGGLLTCSGEYDRAQTALDAAEAALRPQVEPATALLVHLARGMWRCATGSWTEAIAQFRAGEQMQELLVTQHALTPQMRGFGVVALLRSGRIDHARAAVERLEAAEAPCGESLTAVAGVRLADGEYERALDMLAPIFERTAPVAHDSTIVQARMLAAQALAERGDRAASEHAVEHALQLAERDRLVLPFVMASGIALLQRHPRHVTAHAQLLTDILDIASGCAVPTDSDVEPLAEALSGAELRVLGYLPSNLSTPEISAELYLSVNTVRTHVRHIYDKLGAHNRSDAVSRARQLGLLGRTSG